MTIAIPALILGIAVSVFVAVTGFTLAYFGMSTRLDAVSSGMLVVVGFLARECWEVKG